jgi:hypothetical protein
MSVTLAEGITALSRGKRAGVRIAVRNTLSANVPEGLLMFKKVSPFLVVAALAAPTAVQAQGVGVQGQVSVGVATPQVPPPPQTVYVQPAPQQVYVQPAPQQVYVQPAQYYAAPRVYGYGPRAVPYNGGPVPPGARVETRAMTGLAIAGGSLFLAFYAPAAIIGVSLSGLYGPAAWFAVPIAGPLIWNATLQTSESRFFWGLSALLTIGQGVGLGMFIAGLAIRRDWLVYDRPYAHRSTRGITEWALAPSAPGTPLGLSFSFTHF